MSKYCPNCGEELNDESLFCRKCGTKLSSQNILTENLQTNSVNNIKPKLKSIRIFISIIIIAVAIIIILIALKNGNTTQEPTFNIGFDEFSENAKESLKIFDWEIVNEHQQQKDRNETVTVYQAITDFSVDDAPPTIINVAVGEQSKEVINIIIASPDSGIAQLACSFFLQIAEIAEGEGAYSVPQQLNTSNTICYKNIAMRITMVQSYYTIVMDSVSDDEIKNNGYTVIG